MFVLKDMFQIDFHGIQINDNYYVYFTATANLPFTTAVNGHVFVPPSSPPQVRESMR